MAASAKGPKHRVLGEDETFTSYEDWQVRMKGILRKDPNYARFLQIGADASWRAVSVGDPHRGLVDDVAGDKTKKETKLLHLTGMLEEIAQWAPHYISHQILEESTSIESVWNIIRSYYNFQQNEVQFMSFLEITWDVANNERPEHLYRRLMSHIHNNRLQKVGALTYKGKPITQNEEVSPTVERLVILRWLELIDPRLPALISRTFAHNLQTMTLKDIQPQISASIDSFLLELKEKDVQASRVRFSERSFQKRKPTFARPTRQNMRPHECRLCKAEGRQYLGHSMERCHHVSNDEKRKLAKAYLVDALPEDDDDDYQQVSDGIDNVHIPEEWLEEPTKVNKVDIAKSPVFHMFYAHHPIAITCDSGATSSLIRYSLAVKLGMDILNTTHTASQADGKTKMTIRGEVHVAFTRNDMKFLLEAIAVEELDCEVLAGVPFMKKNAIVLDLPNEQILIAGKHCIPYSSAGGRDTSVRSQVLKASTTSVLFPGEYIELQYPQAQENVDIVIEPRYDAQYKNWITPTVSQAVGGVIRLPNLTAEPVSIKKHQHLAQVHVASLNTDIPCQSIPVLSTQAQLDTTNKQNYTDAIKVDPHGSLTLHDKRAFSDLHSRYDHVFNKKIGVYNDASGRLRAYINMGSVEPPQTKAYLPSYNTEKMNILQNKMDELEQLGVLARPEDIGIKVEYVSPSFLVKKGNGDHRLVTAFNTIGSYTKPLPSKSTSTDDILRFLAKHKFIIKTDMTKQFFQLLMERSSLKYLGIMTPYKGMRVYTRAAMGMPGSTEHLDELMTRVLGDLMQAGMVVKLADDLYTGGNSIDELLHNWELILQRFEANNLRLSAEKTEICPGTCTILGWIWSHGTISVSPHKVTPLKSASPPKTVKALRSWLGAYKHLKVCLSGHSMLLSDLEKATAGKASQSPVEWTPSLTTAFHDAQQALSSLKCITIPRPSDKLIITNDGAVKLGGVGAVLYIIRDSKMLLGGFFSAKLKTHQVKWLPCEIEALAIASSVNHWAPYIIENNHTVQLLTDSRPCVQAFTKLGRGEFSSSARVSSFLSSLSRHNVTLQYIPGDANAPADFQSRNPADCTNLACQICKFVRECEESTVLQITVTDVLNGTSRMPFMSPLTWKSSQQDCPTLRRTYAHLQQGTRPGRKATHVGNLKRYLQVCAIGRHGLLVVRRDRPFATSQDLTVIPSHILPGLLSALHLRLQHPTKSQLSKVFHRYFFALDAEIEIQRVTQTCDQCVALARLPKECEDFSTSELPAVLGTEFACDILRRAKQCIFIIRDSFSSYTVSKLIPDEKSTTLKAALIECTADLISPSGCCVRVDGASSFQSLVEDPYLTSRHIKLVVGRIKNRNKNPVGEKAVQELEYELNRCQPDGSPITASQLAVTTAH